MNGVILTAGTVDASLAPLFGSIPTGLIPVNGKPILFHIIENMITAGIDTLYIGVHGQAEYIEKIASTFFARKVDLHFVKVDGTGGPGTTLLNIFGRIGSGPALVNLGDTLVRFHGKAASGRNVVYVARQDDPSDRWCTLECDEESREVTRFHEKEASVSPGNVVVGVYHFREVDCFREFRSGGKCRLEISDLLVHAMNFAPCYAVVTDQWLDFGHIDKYQSARKKMLGSRHFNSLEFDDLMGTITKRSGKTAKFVDEIRYQLEVPPKLKVLFPRILDYEIHTRAPYLTMEYYSYQTLSELWLYSSFGANGLCSIVRRLFNVLELFREYEMSVGIESYRDIYVRKTDDRIGELAAGSAFFRELLEQPHVRINGTTYRNWHSLRDRVAERVSRLYSERFNCLIHGDFCFSNILFDANSGVVRLIDPRGDWGGALGGDFRYDLAKLRHSIAGKYDFIVNDLFLLEGEAGDFRYECFTQPHHDEVAGWFDGFVSEKYDLDEIRFIESLLFMSMIPLHSDSLERQIMMYCRGIELLNEALPE